MQMPSGGKYSFVYQTRRWGSETYSIKKPQSTEIMQFNMLTILGDTIITFFKFKIFTMVGLAVKDFETSRKRRW